MDAASNTASGEATAPAPTFKPCRFCQIPVQQPKRRDMVKDFCTDRHRAAFRDAQVQAAMREAQAAVTETKDELARLQARLDGALTLLERYQRHGTRPRKTAAQVQPSQELTKAFTSLGVGGKDSTDQGT